MEKQLKIKPLTKAQIMISIDRLTRFKPTEEKYLRVFKDIVVSNLIYPKYKKNELNMLNNIVLTEIINEIFKTSFLQFGFDEGNDFSINKMLLQYEKSVFKFDKNVEGLLDNKIDYNAFVKIFETEKDLPLNLLWLKSLSQNSNQIAGQIEIRTNFGLKFPLEKVVITEGITEEILLPKFALLCGFDFNKSGIHLISAGGKNQVVKLFYKYTEILNLPIFVLLDNDAEDNFEEIKPKMRNFDKVHILNCGEFEDLLPLNLIKRTLNRYFKNFVSIGVDDLRKDLPMTKTLTDVFKTCGKEFKKAEFAALIAQNIQDEKDISDEIKLIINEIKR